MHFVSYFLSTTALGPSLSCSSRAVSSDCDKVSWAEDEESQEGDDV